MAPASGESRAGREVIFAGLGSWCYDYDKYIWSSIDEGEQEVIVMTTSKVMIDLILPLPDVIVWSSRVVHTEISGINLRTHSPLITSR